MMMETTYELTTIRDLYEKVPADRRAACVAEILRGMEYADSLGALMGERLAWQEPCQWIDDGKTDQTIQVQDSQTDDLLTFTARKD
jgi:hypothetical protein